MKKATIAILSLSLSTYIYADEGVRFFNVKNYVVGDAKVGSYLQLEQKVEPMNGKAPNVAACSAKTHHAEGKKNELIKIEGNHTSEVRNYNNFKCRGHLKYVIKCTDAAFVHEGDFELNPSSNLYDKGHTETLIQKQRSGTWTIEARTTITGDCGINEDVDTARLRVN